MNVKQMKPYQFAKKIYYDKILFRNLKPKWNCRTVAVNFYGQTFKIELQDEMSPVRRVYHPRLNDALSFLDEEILSYLQLTRPLKGQTVLDCGAHFGAFSLYASASVGEEGKVVSFEPDPFNRNFLERNLIINKTNNVLVNGAALCSYEGSTLLNQDGASSTIFTDEGVRVRTSTIDRELEKLGLVPEEIDFVKMDIEGAEIEAIEGAKRLLTKGKPFLAIASYHLRRGERTARHLERRLPDFGYTVKTGFPRHLTTWAWKS